MPCDNGLDSLSMSLTMSAILHFVSRGRRRDIAGRRGLFFLVAVFWALFYPAPAAWPVNSVCSAPATGLECAVPQSPSPGPVTTLPQHLWCERCALQASRRQGNLNYSCAFFSLSAGLSPRTSFPTGLPIWKRHTRRSNHSGTHQPQPAWTYGFFLAGLVTVD